MHTGIVLHRDFSIAPVDSRLFGANVDEADLHRAADRGHCAPEELVDLLRAFGIAMVSGGMAADVGTAIGSSRLLALQPDGNAPDADPCTGHAGHLAVIAPPEQGGDPLLQARVQHSRRRYPVAGIAVASDWLDHGPLPDGIDMVLMENAGDPAPGAAMRLEERIDGLDRRLSGLRRGKRPPAIALKDWGRDFDRIERALAVNALLRRAGRVRVATAAGVLQSASELMTPALGMGHRPGGPDPVLIAAAMARGIAMMPAFRQRQTAAQDGLPLVDVAATATGDGSGVTLFLVNRSRVESATLSVELAGFARMNIAEHRLAPTLPRRPGQLSPPPVQWEGGSVCWALPPASYAVLRMARPVVQEDAHSEPQIRQNAIVELAD